MALQPIDFQQLLGSLRADGKLILTTVIKAAAGKRFVTDARDTPSSLDVDLEDEAGVVETVSIPKGSAVDATARAAAAAAQAEIEDHETNHPSGGGTGDDATPCGGAGQHRPGIPADQGPGADGGPQGRQLMPQSIAEIDTETGQVRLSWTVSNVL